MPTTPLRPCLTPGCPERVAFGRCTTHRKQYQLYRGTSASRGYGSAWQAFRLRYLGQLVALGIPPVCGARLPDGPTTAHSQCHALGLLNGVGLHLDHDPPLTEVERTDRATVCDAQRIVLLCASCHSIKTATEEGVGQ